MNKQWNPAKREYRSVWVLGLALLGGFAVRAAWSQLNPPPLDNRLALSRGCRTGNGGLNQILPEYVSVRRADSPEIAEGVVVRTEVATNDAPHNHFSHDKTFHVALDGPFGGLHSDANSVQNGTRLMETEWETKFFPPEFWPIPGDRVWMMGRWIFDCGHPPYHTEFHPPLAVAFSRTEPTIFPGDTKPTLAKRTSIYIHGRGGYHDAPVAVRDYEFDIPLPPRPSLRHRVRAEVLGRDEFGRVSLPFGGPPPILTVPDATRVHVRYPLAAINDRSPDRKFGAVIATAWVDPLTAIGAPTFRVLRVTFDSIRINTDHDPFTSGSGEWRLWVRAGSQWFEVRGLGDVDDGDTIRINRSIFLTVPDSGTTPVAIQTIGYEDDCDSQFAKTSIRSPSLGDIACLANGNDEIGFIADVHTRGENFGVGTHNIASTRNPDGSSDTGGDFNLRYRIEQTSVINPPTVLNPTRPGTIGR
jgi:hypothetical protein